MPFLLLLNHQFGNFPAMNMVAFALSSITILLLLSTEGIYSWYYSTCKGETLENLKSQFSQCLSESKTKLRLHHNKFQEEANLEGDIGG